MDKVFRISFSFFFLLLLIACQSNDLLPSKQAQPGISPSPILKAGKTSRPDTTSTQVKPIVATTATPLNLRITVQNAQNVKKIGSIGIGPTSNISWSPLGDQLAAISTSGICLFNPKNMELEHCFGEGEYSDIAYSPDGKQIAAVKTPPENLSPESIPIAPDKIELWGINADKPVLIGETGVIWISAEFSPDGKKLACVSQDGFVYFWDLQSGKVEQKIGSNVEENRITAMKFAPDGKRIVVTKSDGYTDVLELMNTTKLFTLKSGPTGRYLSEPHILVSSNGKTLVTTGEEVIAWNLDSGDELFRFGENTFTDNQIKTAVLFPDGQFLIVGNDIWDLQNKKKVGTINLPGIPLEISPDSKSIAAGLGEVTISVLYKPVKIFSFGNFTDQEVPIAVSLDQTLLAQGVGGDLQVWDLPQEKSITTLKVKNNQVRKFIRIALSPDKKYLAASDHLGSVSLWNLSDGTLITTITPGLILGTSNALAFSPDSRYLVVSGAFSIFLLDVLKPAEVNKHEQKYVIENLVFSPDGKTLIARLRENPDASIAIFNPSTLTVTNLIKDDAPRFNDDYPTIVFSPKGDYFVTRFSIGIGIFSTGDKGLSNLLYFRNAITTMAYHPTMPRMLTGAADGSILEWDLMTGKIINNYYGPVNRTVYLSYSNDGSKILAGSDDGYFYEWSVQSGGVRSNLNPSCDEISISKTGNTLACYGYRTEFWNLSTRSQIFSMQIWGNKASPQIINEIEKISEPSFILSSQKKFWLNYKQLRTLLPDGDVIADDLVILSPDSKRLAVGFSQSSSNTSIVGVINLESKELLNKWEFPAPIFPMKLCFSSDGTILFATRGTVNQKDGLAALNISTGEMKSFGAFEVNPIALSQDGSILASGLSDISIYDTKTLELIGSIRGGDKVKSLAFSPDGTILVAALETQKFIPSGNGVAAKSVNITQISIWETRSGKLLKTLDGRDAQCSELVFNPDGNSFISSKCLVGSINIWGISP